MQITLQILVNGLMTGSVYFLVALGFTLIFGIMRIVNFAHGEFYMMGAYAVYFLVGQMGLNYFVALPLGALLVGVISIVIERGLFRPVLKQGDDGMIMALGISIVLQALALIVFGPLDQSVPRVFNGVLRSEGVALPLDRLFVAAAAVVILLGFYLILFRTRLGLAMRAVAQDKSMAALHGIPPSLINSSAFGIASIMAALAGGLMAPIYTVSPYMGVTPMLKSFVVVILGGLGSIPGAMVGGLLIGVIESAFATLTNTILASIISFVIVLLIVIVRPQGLFGKALE
jgi:branched-chain amino acid transport system permease protein